MYIVACFLSSVHNGGQVRWGDRELDFNRFTSVLFTQSPCLIIKHPQSVYICSHIAVIKWFYGALVGALSSSWRLGFFWVFVLPICSFSLPWLVCQMHSLTRCMFVQRHGLLLTPVSRQRLVHPVAHCQFYNIFIISPMHQFQITATTGENN